MGYQKQNLQNVSPVAIGHGSHAKSIRIACSISRFIVDKNRYGDTGAYSSPWEPVDFSAQELATHVRKGLAFSAQYDQQIRKSANFSCVSYVAADFDGNVSYDETLNHIFVKQYATLAYTTPSHLKDGKDHFRIVFALKSAIGSADRWKNALIGLALELNADMAATDGARICFGSENCEPIVLSGQLPESELKRLIKRGKDHRAAKRAEIRDDDQRSEQKMLVDLEVRLSDGSIKLASELLKNERVHCPFHDDQRPSAFVVLSSFGSIGIRCTACQQTFWIEDAKCGGYDFYALDQNPELLFPLNAPANPKKTIIPGLEICEITRLDQRFLGEIPLRPGVTLVRSSKGSGKTHSIAQLVQQAKATKKSVLLIGHRRTLLRELAKRLFMHCYLDDIEPVSDGKKQIKRPDYYAVSIDSLATRLSHARGYDIVIVDEAEQVLAHTISETISKPEQVLAGLQTYLALTPSVVLLDADLNTITTRFLIACRQTEKQVHIVLNAFKPASRECQLFKSKPALVLDILMSLEQGKRIYVACNSKRWAKTLSEFLRKHLGTSLKVLLVTAEDRATPEVARLLENIKVAILDYEIVIASPALGTGIDITFPNDEALIDVVYGFFEAGINSHYDVDQQLGRVRNPKEVKVWVSPKRNRYETDVEAIKQSMMHIGNSGATVTGWTDTGQPIYDEGTPRLCLRSEVYCAQRASQNNLRGLFIQHKEHCGWRIQEVAGPKTQVGLSKKIEEAGEELKIREATAISNARQIEYQEYINLKRDEDDGFQIGLDNYQALRRFEYKDFYCTEVDPELILQDHGGALAQKIEMFEQVLVDSEAQKAFDWKYIEKDKPLPAQRDLVIRRGDLIMAALRQSGLYAGEGRLNKEAIVTLDSLVDLHTFCIEKKLYFQQYLNLVLPLTFPRDRVKVLNAILSKIGLRVKAVRQTKVRGRKIYKYAIDEVQLAFVEEIVKRREAVAFSKYERESFVTRPSSAGRRAKLTARDTVLDVFDFSDP